MGDLQGEHDARKEEGQPNDEEGVRTEMRHLVDDAPHAQTACHLPHRLPVQERDAPDIREMREDERPNGFQYVLHGVPPLISILYVPLPPQAVPLPRHTGEAMFPPLAFLWQTGNTIHPS